MVLDWGLNLGPPVLDASTIPIGYQGGGNKVILRGLSVFPSPPQRPMTSDFEGFSIPDIIHYIYFPNLILEKEPVFPF